MQLSRQVSEYHLVPSVIGEDRFGFVFPRAENAPAFRDGLADGVSGRETRPQKNQVAAFFVPPDKWSVGNVSASGDGLHPRGLRSLEETVRFSYGIREIGAKLLHPYLTCHVTDIGAVPFNAENHPRCALLRNKERCVETLHSFGRHVEPFGRQYGTVGAQRTVG